MSEIMIDEIGSLIEDLVLTKFKKQVYDQENNLNKNRDERIKNGSIDCYGLTLDIKKNDKNRLRCDIIKEEKTNIYNLCIEIVEKIFDYNGYEPIKQIEIADFTYEINILIDIIDEEEPSLNEDRVICFFDEDGITSVFNNKRRRYYNITNDTNVDFEEMKKNQSHSKRVYKCRHYDYKNFLKGIDLLLLSD